MIELHTLGDALIKVGDREVRPSSPMVFAALLYLCVERGRRVPRAALQELLFPEADERSGSHSVRQLLYKLRQLGVPYESIGNFILLVEAQVVPSSDLSLLGLDLRRDDPSQLGVLPGYHPGISRQYSQWLESYRTSAARSLGRRLALKLSEARLRDDHQAIAQVAHVLLAFDPYNSDATFALAEALAVQGRKLEAVRLLDDYAAEIGSNSELSSATQRLRKRISAFAPSQDDHLPLLGRDADLAWLLSVVDACASKPSRIAMLWGEPGIGKSRLLREALARLCMRDATIYKAHAHEDGKSRPLGALVDLLPQLLEAPGALGVSPPALRLLRRVSGLDPTPIQTADPPQLYDAIVELLRAVSDERRVVLAVEDGHWLDVFSWQLLQDDRVYTDCALSAIITTRSEPLALAQASQTWRILTRHLGPLDRRASEELLRRSVGSAALIDERVRDQCVALANGNPLCLLALAVHLRTGAAPPEQANLKALVRERLSLLNDNSLLFIRFVAAFGTWCTPERVSRATGFSHPQALIALQELSGRGLLLNSGGSLRCFHDLISDTLIEDIPTPLASEVWRAVATTLCRDALDASSTSLHWSAAEAWLQAREYGEAVRQFRVCATEAQRSSQVTLALSALERAQEFATGLDSVSLALEAIAIADTCPDPNAVLRNAARIPTANGQFFDRTFNEYLQVVELQALSRQGLTMWRMRHLLSALALSPTAVDEVRIRAARLYLVAAEQELASDDATTLYESLADLSITQTIKHTTPSFHTHYQAAFGDLSSALTLALDAVASARTADPLVRSALLLDLATIQFRNGDLSGSFASLRESLELSTAAGSIRPQVFACAGFAAFGHAVGDVDVFSEWHLRARRLIDKHRLNPPPIHLANEVDAAILADNDREAAELLQRLANEPESRTRYYRRTILGYSILLQARAGRADSIDPALRQEAILLDEKGQRFFDHDCLTYGLALLKLSERDVDGACQLVDLYAQHWRRERNPLPPYLESLQRGKIVDRPALLHC